MSPPADDASGETTVFEGPVPIRAGGPCPDCGAEILDLEFVSLPVVAFKREMYDVCVVDTDELPTPWSHRTAIAYHEDTDPVPPSGPIGPAIPE